MLKAVLVGEQRAFIVVGVTLTVEFVKELLFFFPCAWRCLCCS